jgi:hypothetical protein
MQVGIVDENEKCKKVKKDPPPSQQIKGRKQREAANA